MPTIIFAPDGQSGCKIAPSNQHIWTYQMKPRFSRNVNPTGVQKAHEKMLILVLSNLITVCYNSEYQPIKSTYISRRNNPWFVFIVYYSYIFVVSN